MILLCAVPVVGFGVTLGAAYRDVQAIGEIKQKIHIGEFDKNCQIRLILLDERKGLIAGLARGLFTVAIGVNGLANALFSSSLASTILLAVGICDIAVTGGLMVGVLYLIHKNSAKIAQHKN
jgi:hypothetical protein